MTKAKCPICSKLAVPDFRPFCSRRCADIDLNRWLTGSYVIGGLDEEEAEDGRQPGAPDAD